MQDLKDNEYYMNKAIEFAKKAASMGEVPVGAVVVSKKTGEIIGYGYNRRETDKSPLAHAEIMAIDMASKNLGGWRVIDSMMFVTLEPCPMCSGAIINARIDDLIFGAYDLKSGSVRSVQNMFDMPYNYKPNVTCGFMEEECSKLLTEFFRELRQKKKQS